jgi:hypothetical protein
VIRGADALLRQISEIINPFTTDQAVFKAVYSQPLAGLISLRMKLPIYILLLCGPVFAEPEITMPSGTTSMESFIGAHNGYKIHIPAGNYRLNNSSGRSGLTIYSFSGELDFASGAKLLCSTADKTAGWCVNIQSANGLVIRGIWVGYANESGLPLARSGAVTGALQIWNSSDITVSNPHVNASTGIGFVIGICKNVSVSQAEVFKTSADGLSFVNDASSSLDGLYVNGTGDDGLSVINYSFYANNSGFVGTNIQSYGSRARGISVPGQSNVAISNFYVSNAEKAGIITQTDYSYQTRRPSHVTWSNGRITGSKLFGIQTDGSDNISYKNIQVSNSRSGGWYGCDDTCNNISASDISLSAGLGGSALYAGSINTGTFSNVTISQNPTYGMFITNSSGLSFSNLSITNVSQTDTLARAWWAENNFGKVSVSGLTVTDNQEAATGFVVGEYSNPANSVTVTSIKPKIAHGTLSIEQTSPGASFKLAQ